MAKVTYKCKKCGRFEDPMQHASGCGGTFVWSEKERGKVECKGCGKIYETDEPYWCGKCRERHSFFTLGRS